MRSFRKELWFETPGRRAFINITPQVEAALKESDVQEGIALINAMHITASASLPIDHRELAQDAHLRRRKLSASIFSMTAYQVA